MATPLTFSLVLTAIADPAQLEGYFENIAAHEKTGILPLEEILPWLHEIKLQGVTFSEAYLCLSELLEEFSGIPEGFLWRVATREYIRLTAERMRSWLGACWSVG